MAVHNSLKSKLDSLASGLQNAAQRDHERKQLSQRDTACTPSPPTGIGAFEVSDTMLKRHKKMDEMQQEANIRISQDATRF